MVKKIIAVALILLSAGVLAFDWYSSTEKLGDVQKAPRDTKDTLWYSYVPSYAWIRGAGNERAVYVNANDFGLEYPVKFHAIDSYLYEANYLYSYKVYAKDRETLLWEMDTPDTSSNDGYNICYFDDAMIMKDDFWISVVPLSGYYPRLVSSDVTDSDHSYYLQDGIWSPLMDNDGRYEWGIDFGLSPYTPDDGPDTYPPAFRGFTKGTENFMEMDAKIELMVQDYNTVVSPALGQYSVNNGTTWVDFTVNYVGEAKGVKGSYIFEGTIPGQPDETTALVKFQFEDSVGNIGWSDINEITWSRYVPLILEDFENEFPPENWTNVPAAGCVGFQQGLASNGIQVHNGQASLLHFYMDGGQVEDDWIWTNEVMIPAQGMSALSFWQSGNWISVYYLYPECEALHEVVISDDNGATWTRLFEGPPVADPTDPYGDLGMWTELVLGLKDYAGKTVKFGFHYHGIYSTEWYVDDVSVAYDGDAPVVTNIIANESLYPALQEYFNNDMVINVTLDDFVGVAECTGHYSFDGGSSWTDVIFSKSKKAEVWSGTLPPRNDEVEGLFYLTYKDLGDVAGTSVNYNIKFVPDVNAPVIAGFDFGSPVFLNDEMTLTLNFEDDSAIASCVGYYSKTDWADSVQVVMAPTKAHNYVYTGVLPAESAVTFGEVKFYVEDVIGYKTASKIYTVKWLDGGVVIFDDFDENHVPTFWDWATPGTKWAVTNEQSYSPTFALSDSPGGNYPDKTKNRIMTMPMEFKDFLAVTAYYWIKFDVEPGWEYVMLQGTTSTDALPDDSQWVTVATYDGYDMPWQFCEVNLGSFAQQSNVRLRFKLDSDTAVNADGAYIDDFKIVGFAEDYAPPLIEYDGPAIITGAEYTIPREFTLPVGMGDYKFNVDLTDLSGISEVKTVFSVDGGAEVEYTAAVSSGVSGTYEVMIPEQPAGSYVVYKVVAIDNSKYKNPGETKTYKIHFGNFLYYQNGDDVVDYLDIIGISPDATAQAIANRITMGPMGTKGHYKSNLVAITIDNYIDTEGGYPSDPMYVHVWQSEGGVPGKDIIEPIYVIPAATDGSNYEITYVDLRPFAAQLSGIEGDVFVGYTTAVTQTCLLYEVAAGHLSVPGYVAFERSWLGKDNGKGELVWAHDPADVYHISAVIDTYEYIDAPVYPTAFQASIELGVGIHLGWAANTEANLAGYNVYRDVTANFIPVTPIGSVAAPATEYLDTPVDGVYYYKVTAVDSLGNESTPSSEIMLEVSGISEVIPLTTELFQNYPNPFNPVTTIKFNLAKDAKVSLKVYNSTGALVEKIADNTMKSGCYSMKFNASKLVSGIYYYTLKVDEKAMTKKMMLIK